MNKSNLKYGKVAINLIIALVVFLGVVFVIPKLLVFFMPFVIGWIIALIASPPVKFLAEKFKIKRRAGSTIVSIGVITAILFTVYGIGSVLFDQITGFVSSLPEMWMELGNDLSMIGKQFDIFLDELPINIQGNFSDIYENMNSYLADFVAFVGTPTVNAVGNFAKNIPNIIISIIMCALSAYFFILEREHISKFMKTNIPKALQEKWNIILDSMKTTIGGYIKAQIKIELWIYLLLVIGLSFLKIEYAFIIALGMAIIDIIPFFGTAIVLVPWAIINILSADYKMAVGLLIIWGVSQLFRQIIQPKIVGDTIGVPPIPTLFLLFIGYRLGSVIGMIIAIPIAIIIVRLWKNGAFDSTLNSVKILFKGMNEFRQLKEEDLSFLEEEKPDKK